MNFTSASPLLPCTAASFTGPRSPARRDLAKPPTRLQPFRVVTVGQRLREGALKHTPYWWEHAAPTATPTPALPIRADVAVVGAGYTGLSAALTLARAGRSVVVFDAGQPGIGASSRNGGMLGDWLKPSFATLARRYGEPRARALIAEAREALDFLGHFIADEGIVCDFSHCGG